MNLDFILGRFRETMQNTIKLATIASVLLLKYFCLDYRKTGKC